MTGDIKGKEIDFIAEKQWKKIYVQVSYLLGSEKTLQREFGVYDSLQDHRPKYVVSMDDISWVPVEGVLHMSVWDFLEKVL